ncbi:MAG: hypothetical protein AB2823_03825 [Candidatus Thiodiazotropha endolucinida]
MIAREFLNLDTSSSHYSAQPNAKPLQLVGTINMLARDLIGKSEIQNRILLDFSNVIENSALTTFFKIGEIRKINPKTEITKVKKAKMIPELNLPSE